MLLLKGLYSLHDPDRTGSWERELIEARGNQCTFVCINTARFNEVGLANEEAFKEKKFVQECEDVRKMMHFLLQQRALVDATPRFVVAHSFGGTTLLGCPDVLGQMEGVAMMASGCGKSATTEKPLLKTLYGQEALLTPLSNFTGAFVYIRGTNDVVVPKSSQDAIITAAQHARARTVIEVLGAEHNLTNGNITRATILTTALDALRALA